MVAILEDMKRLLAVVLICIYIVMNNAEHIFTCLIVTERSSLEERRFKSLVWLLVLPWVLG